MERPISTWTHFLSRRCCVARFFHPVCMRAYITCLLTSTRRSFTTQYTPRLARNMASPAVLASRAVLSTVDLSKYDAEQSRLMDERCILVDEQDRALGAADKKTCTCDLQG